MTCKDDVCSPEPVLQRCVHFFLMKMVKILYVYTCILYIFFCFKYIYILYKYTAKMMKHHETPRLCSPTFVGHSPWNIWSRSKNQASTAPISAPEIPRRRGATTSWSRLVRCFGMLGSFSGWYFSRSLCMTVGHLFLEVIGPWVEEGNIIPCCQQCFRSGEHPKQQEKR